MSRSATQAPGWWLHYSRNGPASLNAVIGEEVEGGQPEEVPIEEWPTIVDDIGEQS